MRPSSIDTAYAASASTRIRKWLSICAPIAPSVARISFPCSPLGWEKRSRALEGVLLGLSRSTTAKFYRLELGLFKRPILEGHSNEHDETAGIDISEAEVTLQFATATVGKTSMPIR